MWPAAESTARHKGCPHSAFWELGLCTRQLWQEQTVLSHCAGRGGKAGVVSMTTGGSTVISPKDAACVGTRAHTLSPFWECQRVFAPQIKSYQCQRMVSCHDYLGNESGWSLWILFDTGGSSVSGGLQDLRGSRTFSVAFSLYFFFFWGFLPLSWTKIHRRWQW